MLVSGQPRRIFQSTRTHKAGKAGEFFGVVVKHIRRRIARAIGFKASLPGHCLKFCRAHGVLLSALMAARKCG